MKKETEKIDFKNPESFKIYMKKNPDSDYKEFLKLNLNLKNSDFTILRPSNENSKIDSGFMNQDSEKNHINIIQDSESDFIQDFRFSINTGFLKIDSDKKESKNITESELKKKYIKLIFKKIRIENQILKSVIINTDSDFIFSLKIELKILKKLIQKIEKILNPDLKESEKIEFLDSEIIENNKIFESGIKYKISSDSKIENQVLNNLMIQYYKKQILESNRIQFEYLKKII